MNRPSHEISRMLSRLFQGFCAIAALTMFSLLSVSAQQPAPQPAGSRYDITNYRIEAQLIPEQHMLRAGADITIVPLEPTRSQHVLFRY